jgi:hypothetical protein
MEQNSQTHPGNIPRLSADFGSVLNGSGKLGTLQKRSAGSSTQGKPHLDRA